MIKIRGKKTLGVYPQKKFDGGLPLMWCLKGGVKNRWVLIFYRLDLMPTYFFLASNLNFSCKIFLIEIFPNEIPSPIFGNFGIIFNLIFRLG